MYDGNEMVFTGSEWEAFLLAQLLWRYGWDTYRINDYVNNMLTKFDRFAVFSFKTMRPVGGSFSKVPVSNRLLMV